MFKNRFMLCVGLLFLAGCGPIVNTTYDLTPPDSYDGRMCANQCIVELEACKERCRKDSNQCKTMNLITTAIHKEIPRENCDTENCEKNCQPGYRACHANCGGGVIENKQCVFNCGSFQP